MAADATTLSALREPLLLFALIAVLAAFFAAAWISTGAFHAREKQLAQQWYERGQAELAAGRSEVAISNFRSALLYERDDADYRWSLAEALLSAQQYSQAEAYFRSLLESEPADGRVNLALARVEARSDRVEAAIRYYEDAIYGIWHTNPAEHRFQARLELVRLLLGRGRNTEAEAQLVSLTADLPSSPAALEQVATMFASVNDYSRAAALFARALRAGPDNLEALDGLGTAEFNLGRYSEAREHLEVLLQRDRTNQAAAAMERTAAAVLALDPYARLAGAERRSRVMRIAQAASARLQQCSTIAAGTSEPLTTDLQGLVSRQATLAPRITDRDLRNNPDLVQDALDLAFTIEREAQAICGPMTNTDEALLRIAALHNQ